MLLSDLWLVKYRLLAVDFNSCLMLKSVILSDVNNRFASISFMVNDAWR